jgi:osmotically-inducible protein OsmY
MIDRSAPREENPDMRFAKFGLALMLLSAGCTTRDTAILAAICEKAGKKVEAMSGKAPAHLAGSVRDSMGEASLAARVHNRIHWDRYLAELDVRVHTTAAGTVTLRGSVPDLAIKQRLIDLAKSTVGVQTVEDKLVLPPED